MRYVSAVAMLGILAVLGSSLELGSVGADEKDKAWGTIKGRIIWGGDKLPEPQVADVTKDKEHCLSKGKIHSEEFVVHKDNKGLRWVFVWLVPEPGPEKKPLAINPSLKEVNAKEAVMDQPCCAFEPHALAIREGQDVAAKNAAPVAHNFHTTTDSRVNSAVNILIPSGGTYALKGLRAQRLPVVVTCDIHGWMRAYIGVFDHPYYAVTDADGKFEIKLAPAGDCRMMIYKDVWLGGAEGSKGRKVSIQGGATTDLGNIEWK